MEVRDASNYNEVIAAIAAGVNRVSKIADRTGLDNSAVSAILKKLIILGLVTQDTPFGDKSIKKTKYSLKDPLFRFWHRFAAPHQALLQMEMLDEAWNAVQNSFSTYMGEIFEDVCMQWIFHQNKEHALPHIYTDFGKWWGNNPQEKTQVDLDVVAKDKDDNALIGECKWKNTPQGIDVARTLDERKALISAGNRDLLILSKSGFTPECKKWSSEKGIFLRDFQEIIADIE